MVTKQITEFNPQALNREGQYEFQPTALPSAAGHLVTNAKYHGRHLLLIIVNPTDWNDFAERVDSSRRASTFGDSLFGVPLLQDRDQRERTVSVISLDRKLP